MPRVLNSRDRAIRDCISQASYAKQRAQVAKHDDERTAWNEMANEFLAAAEALFNEAPESDAE